MATSYGLTLSEVTKVLPMRCHTSTVVRWCKKGILAQSGEVIKLNFSRVGKKIFIAPKSLKEFFEKSKLIENSNTRKDS